MSVRLDSFHCTSHFEARRNQVDAALAGLIILVIGDSQMKGLITGLHDQLEDAGAAVHSYLMCGATAQDWLIRSTVSCGRGEHHEKGPVVVSANQRLPTYELTDLIEKNHPNLIIVELGERLEPDHTWVRQEVHTLAGKIAAAHISCVWVGPIWGQDNPSYPNFSPSLTIAKCTTLERFDDQICLSSSLTVSYNLNVDGGKSGGTRTASA